MAGESGFEVGVGKTKQNKEQETLHFPCCSNTAEGSTSPALMFFSLSHPSETLAQGVPLLPLFLP